MEYIRETTMFHEKHTCVTLGKFDGVHLGHRLLLQQLKQYQKLGYRSVVFTFDFQSYGVISERGSSFIYAEEEKKRLISEFAPDVMISFPLNEVTAAIEPEQFIQEVLMQQLDTKVLVVGSDFRFGHKRRGDIEMLKKYEAICGYQLVVMEKRFDGEEVISSTRIRRELKQGHLEIVNRLLGAPYTIFGTVQHGKQLGRTLGMPTVNMIPPKHKLLPPNGVYASCTKIGERNYYGVTNIGCKPTVATEQKKGIETYLFDFNEQVYGEEIQVQLYCFERPEQKFSSLEKLKAQIEKDVNFGKTFFAEEQNVFDTD